MAGLYIKAPSFAFTNGGRKHLKQTLRQVGSELARDVRQALRNSAASGRKYGKHTASSPGQFPARWSGALAKSVAAQVGREGTSVRIYDKQFYSRFLETGAKGGGGKQIGTRTTKAGLTKQRRQRNIRGAAQTSRVMEARPFISVVIARKFPQIGPRVVDAINRDVTFKSTK